MTQALSQADIEAAVAQARKFAAENWGWFMGAGVVLLVAGAAAIAFPLISSLAVEIFAGWIFLIGGIVVVLHAFSTKQWQGFLVNCLIGLLYVAAGAWLLAFPLKGIVTLTLLLSALFLAEGVLEVVMAFRVRPHEGWVWLLLSGLVAIGVGVLISAGLPSSAVWAIGLLTGINMISTGASFVFLALAGRRAARAASTA